MVTHEEILDALGDRSRRRIVSTLLLTGPAPVARIAADLPVSRPAVSQHLRVLRECGLVAYEEIGTRNVYRLDRYGFDQLRAWLDEMWDTALDSFAAFAAAEHERDGPSEDRSDDAPRRRTKEDTP